MELKNSFYLFLLILVFSIAGCATSQDLKAVRSELNQKMEEKLSAVDAELAILKKEQEKNSSTVASMRKGQAKSAADLGDLRENIQQLRGQLETLKKDMARDAKGSDELKDRLDNIALKVNFIENFLEIGKKDSVSDVYDKGIQTPGNGVAAKEPAKKQNKETMYAAAYQTFKDGHYDKSRTEFKCLISRCIHSFLILLFGRFFCCHPITGGLDPFIVNIAYRIFFADFQKVFNKVDFQSNVIQSIL